MLGDRSKNGQGAFNNGFVLLVDFQGIEQGSNRVVEELETLFVIDLQEELKDRRADGRDT